MSAMEEYNQEGVEAIVSAGKPIPGQSLTTNPDAPRPFEGPTEYTKFKDALDYVAAELLQEEVYTQVVLALGDGVSVTDMATQIGYVGFREGKWNPDLMLLLMEPLMYLLMSLCEKAGIEYRVDSEDDGDDESEESILEQKAKNIAEVAKAKIAESSGVPAGALPQNIVAQVEAIEMPQESLLAQPAQPEAQPQESLLDRG
jgi:hypothetical protein|tara:strand:+ start:547 stop:1149 length:603 start_codon:yes stop_codon:yes gene_type:complete